MDFDAVVEKRRSIRKFITDKDVSLKDINTILNCARLSQSARNRQPWYFIISKGTEKDNFSKLLIEGLNQDHPDFNSLKRTKEIIDSSNVIVNVLTDKENYENVSDLVSLGSCIEHMCLEATNLGIGSLWVRFTSKRENELLKYLGYPSKRLVSTVCFGYKDEDPSPRPRKELKDLILSKR